MSYVPPATAPKRRRRWPWIAGGVVVLLIVIVIVVVASNGNRGSNTPAAQNTGAPIVSASSTKATSGHTIVYAVTGHGGASDVTYTTDGMTTTNQESKPTLPWSKTVTLNEDQAIEVAQVMAQGADDSSSITVTITVDGKLVKTASATGYGVASADYTISTY